MEKPEFLHLLAIPNKDDVALLRNELSIATKYMTQDAASSVMLTQHAPPAAGINKRAARHKRQRRNSRLVFQNKDDVYMHDVDNVDAGAEDDTNESHGHDDDEYGDDEHRSYEDDKKGKYVVLSDATSPSAASHVNSRLLNVPTTSAYAGADADVVSNDQQLLQRLEAWYAARAREIDAVSGQVEYAFSLIDLAIECGVPGLRGLRNHLHILSILVYQCGQDISLKDYETKTPYQRLCLLLAGSTDDTILHNLRNIALPVVHMLHQPMQGTSHASCPSSSSSSSSLSSSPLSYNRCIILFTRPTNVSINLGTLRIGRRGQGRAGKQHDEWRG